MATVTQSSAVLDKFETGGVFTALVARFNAWRAHRKTVAALNALSDRELDDIGLTRGQIPAIARDWR